MKSPTLAFTVLLLLTMLVGCAPAVSAEPVAAEQAPLTVYLVRHAEKMADSRDPELSDSGQARAATLATILKDAEVGHVHSSDYKRTRDTAAPVAKVHGLRVELYDPSDLPSLADALRSAGGRHLVVGHSNTTPALAELLGGASGGPIDERGEYDRLYVITIGKDGTVQSTLLRYGVVFEPAPAAPSAP